MFKLPPGEFRNDRQYVTDCPFCGKEEHFEINVEEWKGFCFVCNSSCGNEKSIRWAFSGKLLDVDRENPFRAEYHKDLPSKETVGSAWDHKKSRAFFEGKNIHEMAVRYVGVTYSEEKDEMYVNIEPISRDLPTSLIYRPLHGSKQKWLHLNGVKAQYYGWGIKNFEKRLAEGPANVLICEGLSDLMATRLYDLGIAALGSALNGSWFYWLKKKARKVFWWFDNDPAGHKAYDHCERESVRYGLNFESIRTDRDPKHFVPQFIEDHRFLEEIRRKICHSD